MTRIIPLIFLIGVLFTSCEYEEYHEPYADFSVDYDLIIPLETIFFTNYSEEANYYEWDFGDGSGSNALNPSHYYLNEGIYQVSLAAYYGNRVDYTYMTIEVYMTTLEVVVRDYFNDNLIPSANVVLYPTEFDYNEYINAVYRGVTNYNGIVIIKDLNTKPYYIDVYNNQYNNYTWAADDINNILTLPLEYAKHNVFTVYVDYDPITYKSTDKELKIRKTKNTTSERSLDKKQQQYVK